MADTPSTSQRALYVTVADGDVGVIHSVWFPVDDKRQSNVSKVVLADGTLLDLTIVLGASERGSR